VQAETAQPDAGGSIGSPLPGERTAEIQRETPLPPPPPPHPPATSTDVAGGVAGAGGESDAEIEEIVAVFRLTSSERQTLVEGLALKLAASHQQADALLTQHRVQDLIQSLAADILSGDKTQDMLRMLKTHPLCISLLSGPVEMMLLGIRDEETLLENLGPYEEMLVRKIMSQVFKR
jgi:hypothetical protein